MSMFSMQRFEDRLRDYMEETFHVKIAIEKSGTNDKAKGDRTSILIKVTGASTDADDAFQDLMSLFSSLRTKRYDEKNGKRRSFIGDQPWQSFSHLQMVVGRNLTKQLKWFNTNSIDWNSFVAANEHHRLVYMSIISARPIRISVLRIRKSTTSSTISSVRPPLHTISSWTQLNSWPSGRT